jgi:hypothetical protein
LGRREKAGGEDEDGCGVRVEKCDVKKMKKILAVP